MGEISEINGYDLVDKQARNKVSANPTDDATEALNKLKVGDTIYSVGGGSNVNYKITNFSIINGKYYLSNGKLYEATNYKATGYIDVSLLAETTIRVKTQLHTPCCIVFFNENYGVISYTDSTEHDNAYYEYELDIPTGAQYLGVSMYDTTGLKSIEITVDDYFPDYIMLAGEKIEGVKQSSPSEANLLDSKYTRLAEIDYTLNTSKYWSSSGKMLDSAGYSATDKINVAPYQNKTLYVKTALDTVSFIVFFDKYNNKLSTIGNDGTTYKYYDLTIPQDACYMGVTLRDTTNKLTIRIVADSNATAITQNGLAIQEVKDKFEITNYTIKENSYYYGVNGSLQTNESYYSLTIRVDLFKGSDIDIFTRLDNGIAAIVFLDNNLSKISAVTDTTRTYKKYTVAVPDNAKYLGISCFGTTTQYKIRVFVNEISSALNHVGEILDAQQTEYTKLAYNADGGDARIFTKWGAIGDSLSNGVLEYTNSAGTSQAIVDRSYSFIQYIARKLGITAHNYSKGGTTAKEMYGMDQDGMYESKEQIYTLGFGTNDAGLTEYTGGWGTAADINVDDYTQNADSFAGYVARIIQKLRTTNPKAIFFLLTKPLAPQAEQLAAIQAVASVLDDVYVIDMTTYSTKVLSKYKVGAHCSIYGYKLMADFILNSIANTINSDPAHFNDVFRIGTEYIN